MKRLILLLSLTALVSGCTLLGDDSDDVLSASTYLPLTTGATWTWGWVDSTGAAEDSYTDTIAGTISHLGKTYWVIEETYVGSSSLDSTLVRLDGDILYSLSLYSQAAKPAHRAKTAYYGNTEAVWYKFGVDPGATWTIYSYTYDWGTVTEVGEYAGTESVTTPAGTFADCAKFTYTMTSASTSGTPFVEVRTEWLAPNIGPVKSTIVIPGYEDSGSTEVVTAYAIP